MDCHVIRYTIRALFMLLALWGAFRCPMPVSGETILTAESDLWIRSPSNPLFGGASGSADYEPSVIFDGGTLKMWYGTPWGNDPQVNYATSADGVIWTNYGSNPVLGQGGSGYTGDAVRSRVTKIGSTYYMYFSDNVADTGNLKRSTSSDGITWATPTTTLANNALGGNTGWASPFVWQEGSVWYLLVERPVSSQWCIALFDSADGISWSNVSARLTSLQPGGGNVGDAGRPWLTKIGSTYHVWYHGNSVGGGIPLSIYHATSTDRVNWTIANSGNPVLALTGVTPEVDQASDVGLLEVGGRTLLYFNGIDNAAELSKIELLIYNGTLSQLVNGVDAWYHVGRTRRPPLP